MYRYSAPSALLLTVALASNAHSQIQADSGASLTDREKMLLDRIEQLQQRISALENKAANNVSPTPASATLSSSSIQATPPNLPTLEKSPLTFSNGTTLSFGFDAYYGYNFNHPISRVNLLRAFDVTSNNFTVSQAGVIMERAPDLSAHRRFGYRLGLIFGQSTDAMQGSAQNEPRPQIYRNVFQAYGSYILPIGSGLQVDFGKFASSLGHESNYVKDQLNYSRSYFFNFLPFYHAGMRATYNLSSKLSLQYWLVNC